ncbi:MAG: hypothetical protein WCS90_02030 [Bacilli bacterium]
MKKHLIEAGLFFLLAPLLGNTFQSIDPRNRYFRIPTQVIDSLNESKSNLSHSLTIQATHRCFLRFTMSLTNSALQGKLIDYSGDPLQKTMEGYIMVSPRQQERVLSSGQTMSLRWTYPARYLLESNFVELRVNIYEDEYATDFVGVILGFRLAVFHPKDWAIVGSGSIRRDSSYGIALRYPEYSGLQEWSTDYENCFIHYENPWQNVLPLSSVRFRSRDYDGFPHRLTYSNAYLQLNNDEGDFSIGEPHHNAISRWRIFRLSLAEAGDGYYASFRLQDEYAVSIDGRYMKKASERTERDVLTHALYLPPVKTGEAKTYSFRLFVEKAGEYRLDSFHWDFTLDKDKNYFGSLPNSDYAVEVS